MSLVARYKDDTRNMVLLLIGLVVVVAVLSPVRVFPMNDDWAYSAAARDMAHGDFKPHESSMAISLSHVAWGALFVFLFGFSFTVLSVANLAMSAICLLLFYLLLREVGLNARHALFGSALLGVNPVYVYLSFSFMTDVTFLALSLASLLLYLKGAGEEGAGRRYAWLVAGSGFAAAAYLTRQFGVLIVPAALAYLWWVRKLGWRSIVSAALLPALVVGAYTLWERAQPPTLGAMDLARLSRLATEQPLEYLVRRAQGFSWSLGLVGLSLLPLAVRPRRLWLALALFTGQVVLLLRSASVYGTVFPQSGNIVDHTGHVMGFYNAESNWTPAVWIFLGVIGAASISLFLARLAELGWEWVRSRPWRLAARPCHPPLMLYVWCALMVATLLVFPPFIFDRYMLPVIVPLMVPALRRIGRAKAESEALPMNDGPQVWRWALVGVIGAYALLAMRDYLAHAEARWRGAEGLVAQGKSLNQIDAGFEWLAWHLYDSGASKIRETGNFIYAYFPPHAVLDSVYLVTDLPQEGYSEIGRVGYSSWLNGGTTRYVLLLERNP